MEDTFCSKCYACIPLQKELRPWRCSLCRIGKKPERVKCQLCGQRNGIFQKTNSGYIHFMCSLLFSQCIRYTEKPANGLEALESEVTLDIAKASQVPCRTCDEKKLPTLACADCEQHYHFSCVPSGRQWHIRDAEFRCGCREEPYFKVLKNLPRKRQRQSKHGPGVKQFTAAWEYFLSIAQWEPFVSGQWIQKALPKREYEVIKTYATDLYTRRRLETRYEGRCEGTFCSQLADLGPLDYSIDTWRSMNTDRSKKLECTIRCKCSPDACCNRQISTKTGPVLGTDVVERPTWGFDRRTATLLDLILRFFEPQSSSLDFIEGPLQRAVNERNSPHIRDALQLLRRQKSLKDKAEYLLAVFANLDSVRPGTVDMYFRLHPKGTGVVCQQPKGIKANSFIVEYLGELYSPAKWFEKQDVIKRCYASLPKSKRKLPDFYNIFLERHSEDKLGYDLLMVDPVCKASFGSRLSHSCHPNCGTVTMVAQGEYTVAMYALRDIQQGEELTFDYVSYTENQDEVAEAVCLCGSRHCRGTYLGYEKAMTQPPHNHSTAHRLWALVSAATEREIKYEKTSRWELSVKRALLHETPYWLKWWTEIVCTVILEDVAQMPVPERKDRKNYWLRNLAITIDKVKYCLSHHFALTKGTQSPIDRLDYTQTLELLKKVAEDLAQLCPEVEYTQVSNVFEARMVLLEFRDFLKSHKLQNRFIADLVHLVAYTRRFFKDNSYAKFSERPSVVRECEVYKTVSNTEITQDLEKTYESKYIQGTMLNWFKHTVEKPDSTYFALKRTVSGIPDFKLFNRNDSRKYNQKKFEQHLRTHHEFPPQQVKMIKTAFGSPILDTYFDKNWLNTCLDDLNKPKAHCGEHIKLIPRSELFDERH